MFGRRTCQRVRFAGQWLIYGDTLDTLYIRYAAFFLLHIGYRFCSGVFICIFIYGHTLDTDYAAFYVFVVLFAFSFTTDYAEVFFAFY